MKKEYVIRVVLDVPAKDGLFDYSVPEDLVPLVKPGCLVAVPFGRDYLQGVVYRCDVEPEITVLKPVRELIDPVPVLTPAQMQLADKLAERCLAPVSACINMLLTEKMRRLSQMKFTLQTEGDISALKKSFSLQISLFQSSDDEMENCRVRNELLDLFEANGRILYQKDLTEKFRDKKWIPVMESLVRKGTVKKEKSFHVSGMKPKMVRMAALSSEITADLPKAPGRTASVSERREAVIQLLARYRDGLAVSDIYAKTICDYDDLKALEKKGIIRLFQAEAWRNHQFYMDEKQMSQNIHLTDEQAAAVNAVSAGLETEGNKKPILLYGVTGSGKTEVYLQSAERALALHQQVLVLVPEISLTPQILHRFEVRFPGVTGVYHSRLDDGERYDTWRRGRSGQYRIIIGPRSALAVPLPDLGLIIVDECHDDSYYQTESMPYFSAVQACADYASYSGAQLVLGSATPTVSQMFKASQSKWVIVPLKQRATGVEPPIVRLVDMRQELKSGNTSIFSRMLSESIQDMLDHGKQSILFLNRRGTATHTFCHMCGTSFDCPKCAIPLTWHAGIHKLVCHFCGYQQDLPEVCPVCGSDEIKQFGAGVEQVEQLLAEKFPDAQVLRMDAETVAERGEHERMLSSFARHDADILIGTQMIAKGLDFPDVQLVGILLADVGINFHDYRVDEHAFQILTQVAGRAGRSTKRGLAVLQTFQPDRYSIRAAAMNSYDVFYKRELKFRREAGYPPFSRMVRIEFAETDNEKSEAEAFQTADFLREKIQKYQLNATRLIGPAPCYFPRLNNRYRWHIILRGPDPVSVLQGLDLSHYKIEVDPPSVL